MWYHDKHPSSNQSLNLVLCKIVINKKGCYWKLQPSDVSQPSGSHCIQRYRQCEAKASSGRPASVPQLKCVCLNSPFEECDVQPSCPHLVIPVAFLHWHPRQTGSIILSHQVTFSQRHFGESYENAHTG